MQKGFEGYDAEMDDFSLHANLFFPEVRLRNFIEIRNQDCVDEKYMYSLLAMYKGIFYNPDALSETEELLKNFTINDIAEFRYNVPRYALDTTVKGSCIKDIIKEILRISETSLKSQNDEDLKYLYSIIELNNQNLTPGDLTDNN
jgi:glutamate--cysteine ligase